MSIFRRKLGLTLYPTAALWCVVFLAAIWLGSVLGVKALLLLIKKSFGSESPSLILWPLLFYSVCLFLWSSNVFSRMDFIKLAKKNGMILFNSSSIIVVILTGWLRSIVRCRLNNMYVIAKLEGPFWSVFMFGEDEKLTVDKLDSTNSVGFACLVNSPVNKSVEIDIDFVNKKELSRTGIPEIDDVLHSFREHLDDFRGRIRIEHDHVCLTVLGGAWFGKRFQERIIKGLDIATKINETLRHKYQLNDWDGLEMKWDFHVQRFVLQRETERHLFS